MSRRAIRGRLIWFDGDPVAGGKVHDIEDGIVLVRDGLIEAVGEDVVVPDGCPVDDHRGRLVMPGLIDTHIHFPQTQVIASYGTQLLDWLERYTFVEEQRFEDPEHAASVADFFLDELFRNGTTTAVVYCSVHAQSADAFFAAAERAGARMIAGKVMMDRNAPEALCDTAESSYRDSRALIERWHGRGRLGYAVTPRFAITSSEGQLDAAGTLLKEHPDCWMQTHLAENHNEIRTVGELFPRHRDYTDVYDQFGLLGPRSVLGHCIHLSDRELACLAERDAVASFCPTSNLFIGSGLFDLARTRLAGVRVALATDVGGGSSYSMLQTAAAAYQVCQLKGLNLDPLRAFWMMTAGNAEALRLGDRIGKLEPGMEADIVVLDPRSTPAKAHRMERIEGDLAPTLFVLMTLGDDRAVTATYVAGVQRVGTGVSPR
ncbi:MAG: guanine deaminase [Geminicoccaceae bacterium]